MIKDIVQKFGSVDLHQIEEAKLMNRTDRKFFINICELPNLLKSINEQYYILEIGGERLQSYSNIYFDNEKNTMFNDHLRGKRNRYKVRVRKYECSNISFLEVKHKTNKGKTIKNRIRYSFIRSLDVWSAKVFIKDNSPFMFVDLVPVLYIRFTRIMLVNINFKERCTIDLNITFKKDNVEEVLDKIAVIEVKTGSFVKNTPILKVLRDMRINPSGFSKYCTGRSMLDSYLKINGYKSKLREIKKVALKYDIS